MAIIFLLIISLVPAYYVNHWLQHIIVPRKSFGRLMLYLLVSLFLVFAYTFLIVMLISNLFPPPKR